MKRCQLTFGLPDRVRQGCNCNMGQNGTVIKIFSLISKPTTTRRSYLLYITSVELPIIAARPKRFRAACVE
jgi:hypothetical protein